MFPGAQNKQLREKAKEALTLQPMAEIAGLVIRNQHGDLTIIEQDRVHVFHGTTLAQLEPSGWRNRALQIAQVECEYWKKVADQDQGPGGNVDGCGIEGMCAAGNIIAGIMMGITPEEFKKRKEENENKTTSDSAGA
jgi:hypothetical protein